ncbi:MAG: beta-propeller domain-containing protein, partial [Pseudomonadota bacterium]
MQRLPILLTTFLLMGCFENEKNCNDPGVQPGILASKVNTTPDYYSTCEELADEMVTDTILRQQTIDEYYDNLCTADAVPVLAMPEVSPDNNITNLQVEGVDEADVVKVSDQYIFYGRPYEIIVVDRRQLTQVMSIPTKTRPQLLVDNEKLIVVQTLGALIADIHATDMSIAPTDSQEKTNITIYDVSSKIQELRSIDVKGLLSQIRLSEEGHLSLVTTQNSWHWDTNV